MSVHNISQFIKAEIWAKALEKYSKKQKFFIKQLRIFIFAIRGFKEDQCPLRASALTFFSLLSIVPVFAMFFSIAKGFGFEKVLEKELLHSFPGQEETIDRIVSFAHAYLQNTRGGIIAFIGIIILFYTVIKVLSNIEKSFNSIWNVQKSRSLIRKFSDYISILVFSPILMILSSSLTVFISSHMQDLTQNYALFEVISPLIIMLMRVFPYLLSWILFAAIYIIMPNTNVKFSAAFYGAVVAGTLFQIVQWGFITFQFGVTKYNAIYGSFAALPLFLILLQISWTIVLLGAEITNASQNIHKYEFEKESKNISIAYFRLLSIHVMQYIVNHFYQEKPIPTSDQISQQLHLPIRLSDNILKHLKKAGLLIEVMKENNELGLAPALYLHRYTISLVTQKIEHMGVENLPIVSSNELITLQKRQQEIEKIIQESTQNVSMLKKL